MSWLVLASTAVSMTLSVGQGRMNRQELLLQVLLIVATAGVILIWRRYFWAAPERRQLDKKGAVIPIAAATRAADAFVDARDERAHLPLLVFHDQGGTEAQIMKDGELMVDR